MPHARFEILLCPWIGCGFVLWFIDFRLELHQDSNLYRAGVAAWEQGPGLVGACPGCGQKVLFSREGKSCVTDDNLPANALLLPDNWATHAILLDGDGNVITV